MATATHARSIRTTTNAPSVPAHFDTEALLSHASLITYALQGLIDDLEAGSELEAAAVRPIFEVALKVAHSARQLHGAGRGR